MSDMADVLKQHSDWMWSIDLGEVLCAGCDWSQRPGLMASSADTFRAHQAAALSAAGFGPVVDAKREAWAEGHESGFWNGRESAGHHEMRYVGLEHAQLNNPYREASNDDQ